MAPTCARLEGGPRRPVAGRPRASRLQAPLICDVGGIPPAVTLTGGNRNDVTQLIPLLDAVPPIRGRRGRPRRSRGSCSPTVATTTTPTAASCAPAASLRGSPAAASRTAPAWADTAGWSSAAFAWLHAFKHLRTRYERRADIHLGLLRLACALICYRHLPASF